MDNQTPDIINEYGNILKTKMGDHLKKAILFGSQARGDADESSDYDILVIVDQRTKQIREMALDAGVEIMNRYEKLFATVIYDEKEWEKAQSFPFAWNIEREGIPL